MFVITENNSVVLGPNDWNKRKFQSFIKEDLELDFNLPQTLDKFLEVSDTVKIYPVQFAPVPEINSRVEILHGPFWTFENNVAIASYVPLKKPIESIKNELLGELANLRWKKETEGFNLELQNTLVRITTERGRRDVFLQAVQLGTNNNSWKFDQVELDAKEKYRVVNNVWLTLSLDELKQIANAISVKVQESFNWENTISTQIKAATTIEELAAIELK